MDLSKAIADLYAEKEKLEQAIAALEELQRSATPGPFPGIKDRRGRKNMGPEERKKVSERMRAYWSSRRNPGNSPHKSGAQGKT